MNKYDIYICYRRNGGEEYAKMLQLGLEKHGCNVFLNHTNVLTESFRNFLKKTIQETPVFMVVLSPNCLDRCAYEDDWVRQEILEAIGCNKKIILVNPDNSFDRIPEDIPDEIKKLVYLYLHTTVFFNDYFEYSINQLVRRISEATNTIASGEQV